MNNIYTIQLEKDIEKDIQVISLSDKKNKKIFTCYGSAARIIYGDLIEHSFWSYTVLNEMGYRDYREIGTSSKAFGKLDLVDHRFNRQQVNLSKYQFKYFLGSLKTHEQGVVLKAEKTQFESALIFWINAVSKLHQEGIVFNADLGSGSYNPITLKNLELFVSYGSGKLSDYMDKSQFVSAMDIDNNADLTALLFVETKKDYLIIDIGFSHC